jgi:hypothetical protein
VVEHGDGSGERLGDACLDQSPSLGDAHSADLDARDRDALCQPVVSAGVVPPGSGDAGSGQNEQQDEQSEQDFPHGLYRR